MKLLPLHLIAGSCLLWSACAVAPLPLTHGPAGELELAPSTAPTGASAAPSALYRERKPSMPFAYVAGRIQDEGDLRDLGVGWRWAFPLDSDGDVAFRVGQEFHVLRIHNHIDDWDEFDDDGNAIGIQWVAAGPEFAFVDSRKVRFHGFVEGFFDSVWGDDDGDERNFGDTTGVGVRPGLGLIVKISPKIALHFEAYGQWTTQDYEVYTRGSSSVRELDNPFSYGWFAGVGCRF